MRQNMSYMAPTKVHVVYVEFQSDTPSIEGIFQNKADADAFAADLTAEQIADGAVVEGENDDDGADWTVTIRTEEHEVR